MNQGNNVLTRNLQLLAMAAVALLFRQEAHAEPADLAIIHAKVVSPPSFVLEDATVVIRGNRIESIGKTGKTPSAKQVIDAHNKTIIPGFIDTHAHLIWGPGSPDSDAAYEEWVRTKLIDNMRDLLEHGFTTLLSVGDYWPQIGKVRERFRSGEMVGPRLLVTGPLVVPVGGHVAADHVACTKVPFCVEHMTRQIATEQEGRAVIRELAAGGVDAIKIAVNDMATSLGKGKRLGQFPPGVQEAIIDEAHAHGLRVVAHSFPYQNAIDSINLGVDALAHGPEIMELDPTKDLSAELIELARTKNVPMTTALAPLHIIKDTRGRDRFITDAYTEGSDLVTPAASKGIDMMWKQLPQIKRYADNGVTLAWGSDTWYLYRLADGQKFQLAELQRTGLSPMQILATGTINAARLLGKEDQLGSIEKGKIADLVIVAADPLKNLDNLFDRVDVVIKDGAVVFAH